MLCYSGQLLSQSPVDITVPLQVAAGLNPPAVLVGWPNPATSDLQLRKRAKGQPGNAWTVVLEESATLRNGYYDTLVSAGLSYEYALVRKTGPLQAYGYAYAAVAAPVVDARGKILVFIDSLSADQLGADLINYKNDLRGEGWQPVPFKTGNSTTVQWVKNQILAAHQADPGQVKAILLIGNVPVPYSGSIAWDLKADHAGAWPCDAYYGDLDGSWTDQTVNLPNTARPANRNVPGDGKFDQNILPSAVELPVGRLDFRHLSPALFGLPPVELLRRYLLKNHRWRTGQFEVPNRALVDDHLGWSGGEAFAADGFRNAYPLTGPNDVVAGDFLNATNPERYLLGFGAGTAGTYSSAGGIGSAADFATDTINVVVANLFGDYFGDWDYEINPLLPALLASKGSVLACGWAGRPHWLLQGLAVGETMGYCLRETQNAQYNDAYGHFNAESSVPIALLGDPTLRAKIVKPAINLTAVSNCTRVNLHWTASPDPDVLGYLVYRAYNLDGPYTRLTPDGITGTDWSDMSAVADTLFYSVRAMKWETVPGGGNFFNSSTGVLQKVVFVPGTAPTVIGLGGTLNCQETSLILGANFQPPTSSYQWYRPDGTPLPGFTATEGGEYTVVATAPNGCTAAATATVFVDTLLPQVNLPAVLTLNCGNPTAFYTVPAASGDIQFTWNGVTVVVGEVIDLSTSGVFRVSSAGNGCAKNYPVQVMQDFTAPGAVATSDGNALDCTHSLVQLFGSAGASGVQYAWTINGEVSLTQNPVVILPGEYCLTVTAPNGCSSTDCVSVTATGEAVTLQIGSSSGACNDGSSIMLQALTTGGTAPFQYNWSNGETTATITLTPGFSGTLGLTVQDAHGCIGTATYSIAAALEIIALKTNASAGGAADGSIDLIVTGGVSPYSYQWSNGSTTEDITGLVSGTYSVTATDAAGCSRMLTVSLLTVGTDALALEYGLRIAPNPAGEAVGVYFRDQATATITLTDLAGRTIATRTGKASAFFFDTTPLSSGLYLLWVELPTGRMGYRLVVGH